MPTIQDGKSAVEQGNLQQARLIFQAILQESPRNEDAWLGLAEVVTDPDDKRICYDNVLKINKNNRAAKEGLRSLEPKANPLIEALGTARPPTYDEEEETEAEAEETVVSEPREFYTPDSTESEMSMPVLIAIGLALSVILFSAFGAMVFYTLTSLTAP